MSMNKNHYVHNSKRGITIQFSPNDNGTVDLTYQNTLDPNEECDTDTFSTKEAREKWIEYVIRQGFKKSNNWHQCKRGM